MPQKTTNKNIKKNVEPNTKFTPFANIEEKQTYAIALKMLGSRHLMVKCLDGREIMASIPGKFKGKSYWINPGMYLLLNLRDYQQDKADVIYVYNNAEVKILVKKKQLQHLFQQENNDNVEFVKDAIENNSDDEIKPLEQQPDRYNDFDSENENDININDL